MSEVKVYTFNIGQGLFNLLTEEVDAETRFCALFDCGTLNNSHPAIEANLNSAVEIINEFGGLKLIVISHQDKDHWNLFVQLFRKLYGIDDEQLYVKNEHNNMVIDLSTNVIVDLDNGRCFDYVYSENDGNIFKVQANANDVIVVNINNHICVAYDHNIPNEVSFLIQGVQIVTKPMDIVEIEQFIKQTLHTADFTAQSMANTIKNTLCNPYYINIFQRIHDENFKYKSINCDIQTVVGGSCREIGYLKFTNLLKLLGSNYFFEMSTYLSINNYPVIAPEHTSFINTNDIEILKNATSTVTKYNFKIQADTTITASILFPGDATYHVFDFLYDKISGKIPVLLLIAPHHGSFDTNIEVDKDKNPFPDNEQPFINLLEKIQPKTVFISALLSKFGHPDFKFLEYVFNFAQDVQQHDIKYSSKLENIKEGIFQSQKAVFSTESNSNKYLLFPDILQGEENEVSKLQQNNFILPPDDLFI